MLICHFLGLAMGLGTGFAHAFLGAAAAKMQGEELIKFRLNSLVISNMGYVGIALLVISGFYMITPYWKVISDMPLLIAKLSLVAILICIIIMINGAARKAKKGIEVEKQFRKMELMGKFTLLIGISIVVLAVKVFR